MNFLCISLSFWACLLVLHSVPMLAQDRLFRQTSPMLSASVVVVIELEGNIIITSSKEHSILATVESKRSGRIWGVSNDHERPAYNIVQQQQGDTLFIKPLERPDLWTIGIATLTETNTHTIAVPHSAKVLVRSNDANLRTDGMFTGLEVWNKKGQCTITIAEEQLHFLHVRAPAITINNTRTDKPDLKREGKGTALYFVESLKGSVYISLMP